MKFMKLTFKPSVSFISDDHECKIFYHIYFYHFKLYFMTIEAESVFNRKHSIVIDGVVTLPANNQCYVMCDYIIL